MPKTLSTSTSRQLIRQMLSQVLEAPPPEDGSFGMAFTATSRTGEEQFVLLSAASHYAFKECVAKHYAQQPTPRLWTQRGIESLLQRVLARLILLPVSDQSCRIEQEVETFRQTFFAPAKRFSTYFPVYNLESLSAPITVGDVRFESCDKEQLLARMSKLSKDESLGVYLSLITEPFTLASVESEAHEADAARVSSYSVLQDTLDVLNFFGHWVNPRPGSRIGVLGGEIGAPPQPWFLATQDDGFTFGPLRSRLRRYPLQLFADMQRSSARVSQAVSLLTHTERSELETAVLTAMKWSGRGAVAALQHEAFLNHAVAIESLLMPPSSTPELGYQLRMRAAYLLRETLPDTLDQLRALYGLRSQIVHNGFTEIQDSDLSDMSRFAATLIIEVLAQEELLSMTWGDAAKWFETRWLVRQ